MSTNRIVKDIVHAINKAIGKEDWRKTSAEVNNLSDLTVKSIINRNTKVLNKKTAQKVESLLISFHAANVFHSGFISPNHAHQAFGEACATIKMFTLATRHLSTKAVPKTKRRSLGGNRHKRKSSRPKIAGIDPGLLYL
ncbi:MAG TPA: hypothetical protein VJB70_03490 [Candidatus Paceibacterota bacterium]|uniref:Uncharacterized protein n=1 Tax=Candidatus Ryanbacteria bacterium RIFCSPHIGHO2_01_FULL_48_27 TaxID=1802115 RepID=A0A1G2FZU5_9BACT|nr:MAG: hypothetical protein A2756_05100 [Candidatus Ryanbacteria bacterium RIFCSPHIGHO2_01_FULL_48_27]